MQVVCPCACQLPLIKTLGEFYKVDVEVKEDKEICCPTLKQGELEVKRIPAIIAYMHRYGGAYFCEQVDQSVQMAHRFYEKFSMLMNIVENPKESQPKLFQHALDEVLSFVDCLNQHVLAEQTFLCCERKSGADVYLAFLLKNCYKHCVTKAMAEKYANVTRYLNTVEAGIEFASQELKFKK